MDSITALTDAPPRSRAGRPTREQAEARHTELLDCALDHFLEKGFEQATIEAIAGAMGMTKRTVYARYTDKASLFRAAVERAIDRLVIAPEKLEALDKGDIEETLNAVAHLRVGQMMTPAGLRLQRIINTESYRFPEIFTSSFERGALPIIQFLTRLIARETEAGRLAVSDPMMAANTFMSMVISGPVRIIVSGHTVSRPEIEKRIQFAIRLFLDGSRPR
jgi:TetR/AcrR family transcriptional repressor of mexJK operon